MDDLDRQLLAALAQMPRGDLADIATDAETNAVTADERLRDLRKEGLLDGVAARIGYDQLGFQTVIVRLSVGLSAVEAIASSLREQPGFMTVYEVTGGENLLAVGTFPDEWTMQAAVSDLVADPDVRSVSVEPVDRVVADDPTPLFEEG